MYDDDWLMICECGSKECRKIIKEFLYLEEKTKLKYLEMGIVPEYNLARIVYNAAGC